MPDAAPPQGSEEPWSYATRLDQPLGSEATDQASVTPGEEPPTTGNGRTRDRSGPARDAEPPEDTRRDGADSEGEAQDENKRDDPDTEAKAGESETRDKRPDDGGEGEPKAKDEAKNEEGEKEPPPPPPSKWVFIAVGLLLAALLAWGGFARWKRNHAAGEAQQATVDRVPEVRTTEAKRDDAPIDLTLPGQTEPFATASLYARATGFISERHADIGSRVEKGDLLVHISSPDLDQQLAQAEAQVGQVKAAEAQAQAQVSQAEANVNLAKVTLARTNQLTERGYDTLQNRDNQTASLQTQQATLDTANAGVKVAEANTRAQLATVDRLKALTGFEDVRAPFDGVVTVRNVDVGDLVNADSATASPLFSLAQDNVIRVTVQVPQNNAVGIRNGLLARIEVPQLPGQLFTGTVTRSSVALLSSARTLNTEVDVPNPDGRLRAGLFTYVTIAVPRTKPDVVVPAEALIFNQHGLQVAVVENDTAQLRMVKAGRDYGTTVSLVEGLNGGEQVILSPPAMLKDKTRVKARRAEDKRPEGGDQPDATKSDKPKNDEDGTKAGPDDKGAGNKGAEDKGGADKPKQPG